ncbi:MAG TPA: NAD(P)H-binding protein [Polyangiaceae bacterium]|nr:NAD(P)H-binding protein [Polyangiaceae bacterium]
MSSSSGTSTLVTGATGFIGRALINALLARGEPVIALSRRPVGSESNEPGVTWRVCDLLSPEALPTAFAGVRVAYYLVHSMGSGRSGYRQLEHRSAEAFVAAAAAADVERIVYLGGPAPPGRPSEHLRSRLEVGEILRSGPVPAVELRASMVIGNGSASWRIVRDLAMRLPIMVLPRWLSSRTRPVALTDVITALIGAARLPLEQSAWFDVPGPDTVSGQQILERIAAIRGRRFLAVKVPLLTPQLSALWLKLVTRADFSVARELVQGLKDDLLPKDDRIWGLIGHTHLLSFDDAARRALASE